MAKFKFRLASYLNLKEKMEEQKKLDYGKALQMLEEEKQVKSNLIFESNDVIQKFKNNMRSKINPNLYKNYLNYIELLKKKIIMQDEIIIKAEIIVEEKRQELTEVLKERKTLEKLKEKELENYYKEQLLAEQKVTDEIVSYQYNKTNDDL